ncbi:hypothetical protein FQR65_LT06808 [Abscondita terminalis]|nr:hypothetical protein FQR65_LT06808 [Abscondita terminalis]
MASTASNPTWIQQYFEEAKLQFLKDLKARGRGDEALSGCPGKPGDELESSCCACAGGSSQEYWESSGAAAAAASLQPEESWDPRDADDPQESLASPSPYDEGYWENRAYWDPIPSTPVQDEEWSDTDCGTYVPQPKKSIILSKSARKNLNLYTK